MKMHVVICLCLGLGLAGWHPAAAKEEKLPAAEEKKEPVYRGKPLSYWIKALKDKDRMTRKEAIQALGGIGPDAKAAVPALLGMVKEKDLFLSSDALASLRKIGTAALPALKKGLKNKEASVRQAVLTVLGTMGADAKSAVPALIKVLNDRTPVAAARPPSPWRASVRLRCPICWKPSRTTRPRSAPAS
jgi:hypothetical protein